MTRSRLELSKRPTVRELAEQINELHGCIDTHFAALEDIQSTDRRESKARDEAIQTQLTVIQTSVSAMAQFFGVLREDARPPHKTVGGWTQWQAMAGVGSAVIAALGAYRLIEGLLVAVLHAAHVFLMNPPH